MDANNEVEIKILSSPGVIAELEREWKADGGMEIVASGPETDPTQLKFGLETVMMIIGIVKAAYAAGDLAVKIYNLLKGQTDRRIVVQTPTGRYEFVHRDDLTEAEVRSVLKKLASIA